MFGKLLVVTAIVALAVSLAARTSHGAGREETYVVKPSDTLWSIAARTYAGDAREGVWKLERRNHLRTTALTPGQRLVVPAG
jgi:nucleoid-associated protein YgaU